METVVPAGFEHERVSGVDIFTSRTINSSLTRPMYVGRRMLGSEAVEWARAMHRDITADYDDSIYASHLVRYADRSLAPSIPMISEVNEVLHAESVEAARQLAEELAATIDVEGRELPKSIEYMYGIAVKYADHRTHQIRFRVDDEISDEEIKKTTAATKRVLGRDRRTEVNDARFKIANYIDGFKPKSRRPTVLDLLNDNAPLGMPIGRVGIYLY